MELSNMKPSEIDGLWFPLAGKLDAIISQQVSYKSGSEDPKKSDGERARYLRYYEEYKRERAAEVADLKLKLEPFEVEWKLRGGWDRYVLCRSDGGHYHGPGTSCHTLRPYRTQVSWMSELSGLTGEEVIELVGYKACTHCFPKAPLSPAWVRTERADKEALAAKRDEKYAKGLALREKKVANVEKRLKRANDKLAQRDWDQGAPFGETHSARYDIKNAEQDLVWAKREVERWLAKRN